MHNYIASWRSLLKDAAISFENREAKTVEQAKELITKGYEYVTEIDNVKLFRKPDSI